MRLSLPPDERLPKENKSRWEPIETKISSVQAGGLDLESVHAGGLCGIATPLDPFHTKSDNLSGQVMAKVGELPPVWETLDISLNLLKQMVSGDTDGENVRPLQPGEMLMLNSATATSVGVVSAVKGKNATLNLRLPIWPTFGHQNYSFTPRRKSLAPHWTWHHRGVKPVIGVLIDTCGWVAVVEARINIDLAYNNNWVQLRLRSHNL